MYKTVIHSRNYTREEDKAMLESDTSHLSAHEIDALRAHCGILISFFHASANSTTVGMVERSWLDGGLLVGLFWHNI